MAMKFGAVRRALEGVEKGFDAAFTPAWNPISQLGALGWFFYWVVVVTGIYLYIFFDTGIHAAYDSVEYLTHVQWYAGGVMRSLHRYASDAMVLVMLLHLTREYVMGRLHGPRWFTWIVGIPVMWAVFASGISGYWLVWDRLAQYVAVATTEWLDALPVFGQPIARNFLDQDALSGRFFTLMIFIHIGVPLFLLFLMWLHISRLTHSKVNPPRGLAAGSLLMLVALALWRPALSQGPADLNSVPGVLRIDWYYLFALPAQDAVSGAWVWIAVAAGTLALAVAPWVRRGARVPVAVVDLNNCNGCGRCFADCPYGAVTLQPRSDGSAYSHEAVVRPDLCAGCGICTGACPTATPFRRRSELVAGIERPDFPVRVLRERSLEAARRLQGEARVLIYGCEPRGGLAAVEDGATAVVTLPCIGMLPPPFIDFLLTRHHVDGILLAGCREGACFHRLGIEWTLRRIARERDPYLRERVSRERIGGAFAGAGEVGRVAAELAALRARLRASGALEGVSGRCVEGPAAKASVERANG